MQALEVEHLTGGERLTITLDWGLARQVTMARFTSWKSIRSDLELRLEASLFFTPLARKPAVKPWARWGFSSDKAPILAPKVS